jgi:DNA-directed RNA polymerase sigma subunit (sigma70/sigma32)
MEKKEFQIFLDSAKKCWDEYESYNEMIKCLEEQGYKKASLDLKGLTLEEIGYILGVTRERVRQLYEQAIKKIKKDIITKKDLKDFL